MQNGCAMTTTYRYSCLPRPVVSNGSLQLSAVQPEYIESIRQWRNAQRPVLRQNGEISVQQQIDYFETQVWPSMEEDCPNNILLAIHRDSQLIGYGGLVHISWQDKRAEVSFLLEPDKADAHPDYVHTFEHYLHTVGELAFTDLQFNRLFTETWATRSIHMQALESAGFEREGVMKEHTIQEGVYTDSIIHGRLAKTIQASE